MSSPELSPLTPDLAPEPAPDTPRPPGKAPPEPRTGPPSRRRLRLAVALVVTLLALAPVVAVLLTRTGRSYVPPGDMALIDLRVRDVSSLEHFPLVGPYSRFGWNHPGPSLFWALAVPSAITRGATWGTQVGGALLQGAAVALMAALAWRRGGLALVATVLVGMSLVYATTDSWIVLEAWNPHIAVPFFALLVFQAWLLTTGDRWLLPGAAVVATFLVQAHVGYTPLVVAIGAVVGAYALVDRRARVDEPSSWRRPVLVAVVLTAVLWAPAVIQSVREPPGNLVEVGRYFAGEGRDEPTLGAGTGVELMARELRWPPTWLTGPDAFDADDRPSRAGSVVLVLGAVGLLALAWASARRRGDTELCRAAVLAATLVAAGVVALAGIIGAPWGFLFYWRPVIGVAVLVVVAAALVRGVGLRHRDAATAVGIAGVVAAVAVVGWGSGGLALAVVRDADVTQRSQVIARDLAGQLDAHRVPEGEILLRLDSISLIAVHRTLYNQLERAGHPVLVDEEYDFRYGASRTASADEVAVVWSVVENGRALAELSLAPEGEVIAVSSPLSSGDEREVFELQRDLVVTLTAADRADLLDHLDSPAVASALGDVDGVEIEALERLAERNLRVERAGGHRAGVVAFPPAAAAVSR